MGLRFRANAAAGLAGALAAAVRHVARCTVVAVVVCATPDFSLAQTTAQNVEVDPVQCWWKTSAASVRMGEPFSVHLTCAALETEAATAVIDRSRLATAAVQFAPFEVMGGSQSADYLTAGRRFMQYHYTLRLVTEDGFGSEVVIPASAITYRIESQVQQDASLQGREQTYQLPALSVRINALVSPSAQHIREASVPTLDDVAAREFRARAFRLVAIILFAVAGLTLVVAALRWFREKRKSGMTAARHFLPHRTVIAGVRRELRTVEREVRGGNWTPDALTRALAAARIVASYLIGTAVAQGERQTQRSGELAVRRGLGRREVIVSGSATAEALRARGLADDMDSALATFTAARYGRTETIDGSALDEALATASRTAAKVASRHTWLAESGRALRDAVRPKQRSWAR